VVEMSEEKPELGGEKSTFKCPHCGAEVDHLVKIGKVPIPQCPVCKKTISKKLVPEGFPVEIIESKPKPKPKPKEEPLIFEGTREEEGLFPGPKPHYVILEEVLRIHRLKEDFIQYAVNKAKRTPGGIHPNVLWNMLVDLNSGIKSKAHAKYIVEDYYAALQKEATKARDLGMPINYPIAIGEPLQPVAAGLPTPPRQETGYYAQRYSTRTYQGYPYQTYLQPQQGITLQQVQEMIQKMIIDQQRQRELQELREKTIRLESKVKEMINR